MAKKSENTTAKTKQPSDETGDSCKSYMLVRTALDSVQLTAIKYYVAGESADEKKKRAEQISGIMKIAIQEINRLQGMNMRCPPGENLCDGFCVPYNCP